MQLFSSGQIVATCGVDAKMQEDKAYADFTRKCLRLHLSGDWGDTCVEDKLLNDASLLDGGRLMSVWQYGDERLWIITESDRSVTTLLLPEEY
jgi:hypothetical protein